MDKETLEKIKVGISMIAIIIICAIMAIWVYNRFFHKPIQDPVGVPGDNAMENPNHNDLTEEERNELYFEDDVNIDYPDESLIFEMDKVVNGYVHQEIDGLDISFGIDESEYAPTEEFANQEEQGEIRLILNPKIVDTTGKETRFIMYLTSTNGTLAKVNNRQSENDIPDGECLFATDKNPTFFRTSFDKEANIPYLYWLSSELGLSSDVIKFRLVGYTTGKFYGNYELSITLNENEKLELSSIDKVIAVESNTREILLEKVNEIISNQMYGVSNLQIEGQPYYDIVNRIYFSDMIAPNGYEVIKRGSLANIENGYYAVTINFNSLGRMYMTLYFNKNINFIGYNLYNFDEYELEYEDTDLYEPNDSGMSERYTENED